MKDKGVAEDNIKEIKEKYWFFWNKKLYNTVYIWETWNILLSSSSSMQLVNYASYNKYTCTCITRCCH